MESGEEVPLILDFFWGDGRRGAVDIRLFLGDGLKICGIFVVLRSVGAHSSVG